MVEQTTGGAVRGVHRTQEAPALRQQLAHSGGAHFSEIGATVHRPVLVVVVEGLEGHVCVCMCVCERVRENVRKNV